MWRMPVKMAEHLYTALGRDGIYKLERVFREKGNYLSLPSQAQLFRRRDKEGKG